MTDIRATATDLPPYKGSPKLDIRQTTLATWRVFSRQPWSLIALLFLVPFLIVLPASIVQGVVKAVANDSRALVIVVAVAAFIIQLAAQFIAQLAILWSAAQVMEGQRFTLGAAIKAAFERIIPYAGLAALTSLVLVVGMLLFVVPGIIALGFLVVAAPACVIERCGPVGSMRRSIMLVRGNWWRSFGTLCLAIFVPILAFAAACLVVYLVLAALDAKALALILILPGVPFLVVIGAIAAILPAVLFLELRALRDGQPRGSGVQPR